MMEKLTVSAKVPVYSVYILNSVIFIKHRSTNYYDKYNCRYKITYNCIAIAHQSKEIRNMGQYRIKVKIKVSRINNSVRGRVPVREEAYPEPPA